MKTIPSVDDFPGMRRMIGRYARELPDIRQLPGNCSKPLHAIDEG
ncbi:MAG: hypothetical protein ACYC35_15730 [Pirellulales bacterium]